MKAALRAGLLLAALVSAPSVRAQAPPPPVLGALAPSNLKKPRPAPPFNMTGTWLHDGSFASFRFGPPYPKFAPSAQAEFDAGEKATAEGRAYKDYIGQCYPAGLPMIMTRVWPIATVQLPTVVYMVSGFENSFRAIYIDGRTHSDPEIVVPSYNGESIGAWEGDTLVVDTRFIEPDKHTIDVGIPISSRFHVIERIRMVDPATLEIKYIMTDPENWEGEWTSTKRWKRVDDQDIVEVECLPDLDEHLPATNSVLNVR